MIDYATTIYEQYIGMDAQTSRILAAATGTEYFLVSWIAVFAVEYEPEICESHL